MQAAGDQNNSSESEVVKIPQNKSPDHTKHAHWATYSCCLYTYVLVDNRIKQIFVLQ